MTTLWRLIHDTDCCPRVCARADELKRAKQFVHSKNFKGEKMNFGQCSWVHLAHAGWTPRVLGRKGASAVIKFTSPCGQTEERLVPVEKLGKNLHDALERQAPRNFRHTRMCVRIR